MKRLDKSEKKVQKRKSHVGDRELGRERRKRRVQAQMMKEKAGGKWMGCREGRERNDWKKHTQGLLLVMDNTKHWPKGKWFWIQLEDSQSCGPLHAIWGRDLAHFPQRWVAMGFKCGRAYMKRHFWSLSEDKNWKKTWNVLFCIRCQIADRQRTIKTAQGPPSAAYNGNRIFFFPGCQPSHSGETKRISST